MKRPKVLTRCVANRYAAPNERIVEFTSKNGGGLISFATLFDGRLAVDVYHCYPTVVVRVGTQRPPRHGA